MGVRCYFLVWVALILCFEQRVVAQNFPKEIMLKPVYYNASIGENIKVVARKYKLSDRTLASRNRIPAHQLFKKVTPIIIGYSLVPDNELSNPPENAFIVDEETVKIYSIIPENFIADSISISPSHFAKLVIQPEEILAPAADITRKPQPTEVKKTETASSTSPANPAPLTAGELAKSGTDDKGDFAPDTTEDTDPAINNISPDKQTGTMESYFADRVREIEESSIDSTDREIEFFESPSGWFAQTYRDQPTIIQRGLIILCFFIFGNITLFVIIISSRIYKTYIEIRKKRLIEVYEPLLANLLFGEYDTEERRMHVVRRIKKRYLVNEFNNEVFLQELLNLHKNFSGDVCDEIRNLYLEFDLLKFSMRKLKAFPWDVKIKGIRELTQMDIKDAYDEIFKFIDSKNPILRLETLLSLIQLSESDPLKFLSNTKAKMTGWQQVNILAILSILNTDDLPDFKRWLNSPNDSVSLFTVRMINHFKQIGSVNAIIPMLEDPREEIREAIIDTIGNLELYGFADQLIDTFGKEQDRLRVKILQVMTKISDDDQIPFFKQELFSPNFAIALNSAIALVKTGPKGKRDLELLLESADERSSKIIKHALDKRIVK